MNLVILNKDMYKGQKYRWKDIENTINDSGLTCTELFKEKGKYKLKLICNCSNKYNADLYEFLNGKQRCCKSQENKSELLRKQFRTNKEDLEQKIYILGKGEYECLNLDNYVNKNSILKFLHKSCGSVTPIKFDKFNSRNQRCKKCAQVLKSLGETIFEIILQKHNINYSKEHIFKDCLSEKSCVLPFDFYIINSSILVEIDGEHHRRASFGNKAFKKTKQNDLIKNNYARDNNISLCRIEYNNGIDEKFKNQVLNFFKNNFDIENIDFDELSDINIHKFNKKRISNNRQNYILIDDQTWNGVDSYYNFLHKKCGCEFKAIFDKVRSKTQSCPECTKKVREYLNWRKAKELIQLKTENKYTLDRQYKNTKEGTRRYVKCNGCGKSEWRLFTNVLYKKGGCICWTEKRLYEGWLNKLIESDKYLSNPKNRLYNNIPIQRWIYRQRKLYNNKKLEENKIEKIKEYQYIYNKIIE